MERVMIFIDGSNLYNRLVELYAGMFEDYQSFRMDFANFSTLLCGDNRRLVHTNYYVVEEVQRLGKVVDHAAFEHPKWTALSKACKGKRIELTPEWLKGCVTVFRAGEEKPR